MTAAVLTLGEALVALRPHGPTPTARAADLSIAGSETNVAIALSRLGHRVAWAGVVGTDALGDLTLRTLRAEGVDVGTVRRCDRQSGMVVFNEVRPGVTAVDYLRTGSAGATLSRQDVDALFDRHEPRVLHLTGITPALSPDAEGAVLHAAETAAAAGVLVSLDVNYRAKLWSRTDARRTLRGLVHLVDVVIASDDELDVLTDGSATEAISHVQALLAEGPSVVLVKHGAAGATEHTASGTRTVAGDPVPELDPVGAGDAFTAGFLSAVLDGTSDGLELACALGAHAVATRGDWEGLPARSHLALVRSASGATIR